MAVDQVAKAHIRRENESPALDRLHAEIAHGEMAIALRALTTASAPDAGIPLAWLRMWIRDETFPVGWTPSRTVGLVDAVRECARCDEGARRCADSGGYEEGGGGAPAG
ncbi:hypothetical protein FIBSPDRAFT_879892 [Athelia psychrophila]|uniref:Uncharacterized protein n=1 Tax=Athelia psychrophila TaxID=1759441 RepID=A0A167THE3_9AGAM|nr:hypothetical protein FIBSPDRAFT_879892 [Fibularhizoctonia sp. CBS 109695]